MSDSVINQMAVLFGYIFLGYTANKLKVLNPSANASFSAFLLKVALPATILNSAFGQTGIDPAAIVPVALMAVIAFTIIPIMGRGLAKLLKWDATYQLMLNYSNLGFMGLPLVESLYGEGNAFHAVIYMMVFNVHIFTVGIMTLKGKGAGEAQTGELSALRGEGWKQTLQRLLSPGILSAVAAFILIFYPVRLPDAIRWMVSGVGNCTTPLAMIVIGSQLAQVRILEILKQRQLYVMAFFKLIGYPVLIYSLYAIGFGTGMRTEIAAILFGLPVAGNVTMLCSEYDGDVGLAAQGTCITTLLSLVTIPMMLFLISAIS